MTAHDPALNRARPSPLRGSRALLALLALSVAAPSLTIGLIGDDYVHRAFLLGHLESGVFEGTWWNMFDNAQPRDTQVAFGALPWWSSPDLKVALLRPLATLSQYLDYWLWPDAPVLMHAHNLVLYALLVWVASALYRRFLPAPTALLAAVLYAIDDGHNLGVAWIASRNTLLTALFGLLTLHSFVRFRATGSRAAALLAASALLLAHASSEGALAIWAYLVAYVLFCDASGKLSRRALWLVPYALLSFGWLALSSAAGYGVQGSGAYLDPRSAPLLFLRELPARFSALLLMQFGITPELAASLPAPLQHALSVVSLAGIGGALWLAWRGPARAVSRFLLLGCLGSLLPLCAIGAVGRLLFISGLGAHALLAQLAFAALERGTAENARRRVFQAFGGLLIATQLAIAVVGVRGAPAWWLRMHHAFYRAALSLPSGAPSEQTVILILNARDYLATPFVQLYHRLFVARGPTITHVLGVSTAPVAIARLDDTSLELAADGGYLADPTSILVRPRDLPFEVGQTFKLYAARVRVEEITHDGRPARISVHTFGLDDPRLHWVAWQDERRRFEQVALPEQGQQLTLPALPRGASLLP